MNAERRAPPVEPVRVLLVTESSDDHRLIADLLDSVADTRFSIDWARSLEVGRSRLEASRFDACLFDHQLPDGNGLDLLQTAIIQGLTLPMIVISGEPSPTIDRHAMTLGAAGFLDKSQLAPAFLERTIRYAVRQQRVAADLARLTLRDDATGLVSPTLFRDRLACALAAARRRDRQVAVIVIDLGRGKDDNGDGQQASACLTAATMRLQQLLRETDTIARLAEHQLALIVEDLRKPKHAALVAEKILESLALIETSKTDSSAATPSLGIALYPTECSEIETLLRMADAAMRRAKTEGGRCYRFGSERIDREARNDMLAHNALQNALLRKELKLRFRPEVALLGDRIGLSAETFWDRPDHDGMPMAELLSTADDPRLLDALTDWTWTAAAWQMQAWQTTGFDRISLALPCLSHRAGDLPILARKIDALIKSAALCSDRIELDLPEDLVLGDLAGGGHALSALKATGIRLALDGFGQSRATLYDVKGHLLDSLKLSHHLYQDLPGDGRRETLIKAIIGLGHDLDLWVVANGVADERQYAFLREAGCDAIQLRHSCPPLSAEAATSWLQEAHASRSMRKPRGLRSTEAMHAPGPVPDRQKTGSEAQAGLG